MQKYEVLALAPEMAFGHSVKRLAGLANSCKSLNKDVKMMTMILFEFVFITEGGGDAMITRFVALMKSSRNRQVSFDKFSKPKTQN